jgi:hypothetical protein
LQDNRKLYGKEHINFESSRLELIENTNHIPEWSADFEPECPRNVWEISARRGAQGPVDLGFAPTEAEHRLRTFESGIGLEKENG